MAPLLWFLTACASTPPPQPIAAQVVTPGPGERVVVDQALVVTDASGSMTNGPEFGRAKALTRAFVAGMPNGSYGAGAIAFGGTERTNVPVAAFQRDPLARWAEGIPEFGKTTPVPSVIRESGAALGAGSGHAALILISDGLPMSNGSRPDAAAALTVARKVAEERRGKLCIYTIQVGDAPEGAAFLESLATLTGCGLARAEANLATPQDLLGFQRAIFLGAAPPAPASPRDSDGDGVVDANDRCPRTPRGAKADSRGCWVIAGLNFDTDRSEIKSEFRPRLDEVVEVLRQNPDVRIRVDGHTDDRGSAAYNQQLSERRAAAVADYITSRGIDASRVESKGFGESAPAVPNDSPENRYRNRRTELSVID
ncbi:MAG: OmpA family protein [Miltoncostaeaceae bacterium]